MLAALDRQQSLDSSTRLQQPQGTPCNSPNVAENYFAPLVLPKQRRKNDTLFDTLESSESNGMSPPIANSASPITPESMAVHTVAGTPFAPRKRPLYRLSVSSGSVPITPGADFFKLEVSATWTHPAAACGSSTPVASTPSSKPSSKTLSPSHALDRMIKEGGRDARLFQGAALEDSEAIPEVGKRHRDQWKAKWTDTKRQSKQLFGKSKRRREDREVTKESESTGFKTGTRDRTGSASGTGSCSIGSAPRSNPSESSTPASSSMHTTSHNFTSFTGTYEYSDLVTASEGTSRPCHSDQEHLKGGCDRDDNCKEEEEDGGEIVPTSSYERLFEKDSFRTKFWKVFRKD